MIDLLVLGAGSVGGGLAVMAADAGLVVAATRRAGALERAELELPTRRLTVRFARPQPARVVLLATKAQDFEPCLEENHALVAGSAHVVVVQNGLGRAALRHRFSLAITWAFAELARDVLRWHGPTRLAVQDQAAGADLRRLFRPDDVAVQVEAPGRFEALLIEKLMVNASLGPLCSVTGKPPSSLLADGRCLERAVQLAAEVAGLAALRGLTVRDPAEVVTSAAEAMGSFPPSMLQDARMDRPLEVDALVLDPLRRLEAAGLPCRRLAQLAREVAASSDGPQTATG